MLLSSWQLLGLYVVHAEIVLHHREPGRSQTGGRVTGTRFPTFILRFFIHRLPGLTVCFIVSLALLLDLNFFQWTMDFLQQISSFVFRSERVVLRVFSRLYFGELLGQAKFLAHGPPLWALVGSHVFFEVWQVFTSRGQSFFFFGGWQTSFGQRSVNDAQVLCLLLINE